MNYTDLNDNELLFMVSESNEDAREELVSKYTGIVYKIASKYTSISDKLGADEKDLVQEGLIGLSKAIDTYDASKNVLFYTYVAICIESSIKSALRMANKKRNYSLNDSISLDKLIDDEDISDEIVKDYSYAPDIKLEDKESYEEMIEIVKKELAPLEYEIFKYKAKGYSNEEITKLTGKNKKAIENTLFRIKSKLKDKIKK